MSTPLSRLHLIVPANPQLTAWTIPKAEWDGVGMPTRQMRWFMWIGVGAQVLFAIGIGVGAWLLTARTGVPLTGWWIAAPVAIFVLIIVEIVWIRRAFRMWDQLRPLVWDANGCVCPWCRTRVDESPCARHGISRENHGTLLNYWQSLATKEIAESTRARRALIDGAPRQPLHWKLTRPLRGLASNSVIALTDPELTQLQRFRAAFPMLVVELCAAALAITLALLLLPKNIASGFITGCWPWFIMMPLFAIVGPLWLTGRLRCSGCGQLCAPDPSKVCPECGADMTRPGAVTRRKRAGAGRYALFFLTLVVFTLSSFITNAVTSVLPAPVRNAIWSATRPPNDYWKNLTPSKMTQAQVDEAAQLLITCAAPGQSRPLFDFDFMSKAQAAGKLPSATHEAAARTIVQATLQVDSGDGLTTASVHPAFGEIILGGSTTPRLVFGGVSIDGGPWSESAAWSLFHHDTEEFWRANGQLKALPEEQLVFRVPLGKLAPGPHTIRARCWIVLHGKMWERYVPQFDASGALVPPPGDAVYKLPLEAHLRH